MSGNCGICHQPVPTAELLGHICVHHPDHYEPLQTWPDGGPVITYDESGVTPEVATEEGTTT